MTASAQISQWARRFVFAGAVWLLAWQVAVLAGVSHRTGVILGLLGFVFHTIFGKGYSLVPSYFDSTLATTRLLPLHLGVAFLGTGLLAVGVERSDASATTIGATLWLLAVFLFVGTLGVTIRGNLTGSDTATGASAAERKDLDRTANRFLPVVLCYLLVGSYELFATETGAPTLLDGYLPRVSHLLGAGTGALLLFTIGFRLLPRFFVATVPRALAAVVLSAGAVAPAILAVSLPAGDLFVVGALLQTVAIVGFAVAILILFVRSDRRRVGLYGVVFGAGAGVIAAGFGLLFAFDGVTAARIGTHARLNLLGLLGLTIIGVSYQFYPPGVSSARFIDDRTALVALCLFAGGLLAEVAGTLAVISLFETLGHLLAVGGAIVHVLILAWLFYER